MGQHFEIFYDYKGGTRKKLIHVHLDIKFNKYEIN